MRLGVGLAAAEVALQGSPLLVLGDGVLDADPPRGLPFACLLEGGDRLGRRGLGRWGWWGAHLVGEGLGQAPIAGVHPGGDGRVLPQQVLDALGFDRGLIVHPARPSPIVVVLIVFCLRLPDTNARRPGRLALGRRTWVSVPSIRSSIPWAAA